ncbi:MAG: hypothetical protein KY432_02480 [Acidobacteria bacterium]|nr:hypothetical protein [Acidobacteriota bacterium]
MPDEASEPPVGGGRKRGGRSVSGRWRTRSIFALLVTAVIVALAIAGNPIAQVSRILLPTIVALLLVVAAIGTGTLAFTLFRRLLGDDTSEHHGDLATSLIVGYPLFGGVEFLFGAISTALPMLLFPVVVFLVIGVWALKARGGTATFDRSFSIGAVILALLLLTAVMLALLPAVSLDEVSYHLAIPRIWIAEGSAAALPLMSHSWFPLGTEAADLPAIALLGTRGAIASHLLHLLIGIAGGIVLVRSLPRTRSSLLGAAAVMSTPAIILGAGWSGTDIPLVAVTLVLFLSLDRYLTGNGGGAWVASSIAAGLLIKYTFLPIVALLVGVALVFAASRRRVLIVASIAGALTGSLFFIRNLILTGNPVEPFLSTTGEEIARFRWSGSWGETLSSYMFDSRLIDDSLGFVLPALALAAVALFRLIEPWRRAATLAMLLMTAVLTLIGPSGRILLPFLVIPAWISLAALNRREDGVGFLAPPVLIVATLIQLTVVWLHIDRLDPLPVVKATVEDRDWVALHRRSMPLIRQGNSLLSSSSSSSGTTLVLGLNELFWFDGRVTGGANFDSARISDHLSGNPEALASRWRAEGIEQVLLYPGHIGVGSVGEAPADRQRMLSLTPDAASALGEALRRHGVPAGRTADAVLYRLRHVPPAAE